LEKLQILEEFDFQQMGECIVTFAKICFGKKEDDFKRVEFSISEF